MHTNTIFNLGKYNLQCAEHDFLFDIWHLNFGIWHLTFGIWYLTFDISHLTFDFWHYDIGTILYHFYGLLRLSQQSEFWWISQSQSWFYNMLSHLKTPGTWHWRALGLHRISCLHLQTPRSSMEGPGIVQTMLMSIWVWDACIFSYLLLQRTWWQSSVESQGAPSLGPELGSSWSVGWDKHQMRRRNCYHTHGSNSCFSNGRYGAVHILCQPNLGVSRPRPPAADMICKERVQPGLKGSFPNAEPILQKTKIWNLARNARIVTLETCKSLWKCPEITEDQQ